jgi:hypothetical protein
VLPAQKIACEFIDRFTCFPYRYKATGSFDAFVPNYYSRFVSIASTRGHSMDITGINNQLWLLWDSPVGALNTMFTQDWTNSIPFARLSRTGLKLSVYEHDIRQNWGTCDCVFFWQNVKKKWTRNLLLSIIHINNIM